MEGDDIIIFMNLDNSKAEKVAKYYSLCGFMTKLEHAGDIDGATFVKLVLAQHLDGFETFRRPDHALAKLGWTKNNVAQSTSRRANALFAAKLDSMKAMYHASTAMVELIDTLKTTVGKTKKLKPHEYDDSYNACPMTNGKAFDERYGAAIKRIT